MSGDGRSAVRVALFVCVAILLGCAAPKQLYEGSPLPREKVALLRGFPFMSYQEGQDGRGNSVAASGRMVVIGLDGKIFNPRVHAAYSGDDFLLPPGKHSLLAYCEHATHGKGPAWVDYSDLFTISFTAREGRTYRYQADFFLGTLDEGPYSGRTLLVAEPGIWDVTENRSADSSNRIDEGAARVPVVFPTLTHIQSAVGGR